MIIASISIGPRQSRRAAGDVLSLASATETLWYPQSSWSFLPEGDSLPADGVSDNGREQAEAAVMGR